MVKSIHFPFSSFSLEIVWKDFVEVINGYVSICHESINGNCSKKNCKFIISVLKNFNGNFFFIIITKLIEAILFYQQIQISPSALFYYVFSFFLVQCFIFSLLNRFEEEEEKEYPVCIRNLLRDKTFHLWYCCVKKKDSLLVELVLLIQFEVLSTREMIDFV